MLRNIVLYNLHAIHIYKQAHYVQIVPIFKYRKHSYLFRLPSVAILSEQQNSDKALLSGLQLKIYTIN